VGCGGLEGGDGCGLWCALFVFVALQHFFDEEGDGTLSLGNSGDFGSGCEDAEGRIDGDLFDSLRFGLCGLEFGKVKARDLETVEEQTGAAGIDLVRGDALNDLADRGLDGGAVFGQREGEGGGAAASMARVLNWFTCGVVVVAELLLAEAWAGAAVAVGEDVAALVLFGGCYGVLHGSGPLSRQMCAKSSKEKT
jgi:hypothetical protein